MRLRHAILPPLLATIACAAEPAPAPAEPEHSPREEALDRLMTERSSPAALDSAIAAAREQGISAQAILEARFIYHVDRQEDAALAALLPEFEKQDAAFKLGESEIFATREDWQAVIEYLRAIKALGAGDKAAFKKHITEAFWLSPKQGTAFATHIERLRLEETMASVKIDFTTLFTRLTGGEPASLAEVLGGKKALLLHFWSPWSTGSESFLPDFIGITEELEKNSIAVATIVMEDSPKSLADASQILATLGPKPPGVWLVDHKEDALSPTLRIQDLPALVLVSPQGSILHNGSAGDEGLWKALGGISPGIRKPAASAPVDDR